MLDSVDIAELAAAWRDDASTLKRYGATSQAAAIEHLIADLESRSVKSDDQRLTLSEAAEKSGYSVDHLGRMIRSGQLANAGRKGAPRVRSGDVFRLGKRPGSPPKSRAAPTFRSTRKQIARAVVNRHQEAQDDTL